MSIDLTEYTSLKDMLADGWVVATNGIDREILFCSICFDSEKNKHYSLFRKKLPSGDPTHWKYV